MHPYKVAVTLVSLFNGLGIAAAPTNKRPDPTVRIPSGTVIGTATSVFGTPTASVNAYLGIPFAQSPPLRFAPPSPPAAWSKPLRANKLPPACVQQFPGSGSFREDTMEFFNNPGLPPPAESEDCLYINVYAPATASRKNTKPVMFWIYGGDLEFGTGSLSYYNGSRLAATNDVVVVTFNYRTNIFGFSNSPQIPFGQQNAGYHDQRFALAWVQRNIAYFGGNANKVTIFGESAGGYSVKQLLANPPKPLPFHAAILESQASTISSTSSESYSQVVANFNCTFAPSPVNCLRAISALDIKSYIESQSLAFSPVENDGTQVTDVRPSVVSGRFAKVPILIGTNADEGRVFAALFGLSNNNTALTQETVESLVGPNNPELTQRIITQAKRAYSSNVTDVPYLLASQILTDLEFTCPTSTLSNYLSTHGYQVWRYLYSGFFPDTSIFHDAGAYHSSEIPEVFGTYPLSSIFGTVTKPQIQLSIKMRKAWTDFSKNPKYGPGWPALGTNGGKELQKFGGNNSDAVTLRYLSSADDVCVIYDPIDTLIGVGYR